MRVLLLYFICMCMITGCGFTINSNSTETDTKKVETVSESNKDTKTSNDEKKSSGKSNGSGMVEIIMPAWFYADVNQEDAVNVLKNSGIEVVTINADQSFTLRMTKDLQLEYRDSMKESIDTLIKELLGDPDTFPSLKEITYNPEMTLMEVIADQSLYFENDDDYALNDVHFLMAGYQLYNNLLEKDLKFDLVVIDEKTGKVFDTTSLD